MMTASDGNPFSVHAETYQAATAHSCFTLNWPLLN
jgi:hypothetical protein